LISEEQKKQYQKLINYGRLNALIDNDELIFQDHLLNEDQLLMADKVKSTFSYLQTARELIYEEKEYSN